MWWGGGIKYKIQFIKFKILHNHRKFQEKNLKCVFNTKIEKSTLHKETLVLCICNSFLRILMYKN